MKLKHFLVLAIVLVISLLFLFVFSKRGENRDVLSQDEQNPVQNKPIPLSIEAMRQVPYPGSEIEIEQTLTPEAGSNRYIASYRSEGLKIYALLTVPVGQKPEQGWPVIIFNHGYIPPEEYRTTERYASYVNGFASEGYVVFKPDYRGHGDSEGDPTGAYFSPSYTADVLNALNSFKNYNLSINREENLINPEKMGMWGHSMGGHLTLRSMVVSKDVKAGVIWAGVVASYEDMMNRWNRKSPWRPSERENMSRRPSRQELIDTFGDFNQNPDFWRSISPIYHIDEISGPVQLHHGLSDDTVPWEFSESLNNALIEKGKEVQYFTYPGADHNLSGSAFSLAMTRSVQFFDQYLK